MSIDAHIIFKDGRESHETYKHWDGYPDATISTLRRFLEWMPSCLYNQGGYVTASWFYWVKAHRYDFEEEPIHNTDLVYRYGTRGNGAPERYAIDHTYVVDLEAEKIEHYGTDVSQNERLLDGLVGKEPDNVYEFVEADSDER